jgi:hypothetical protein
MRIATFCFEEPRAILVPVEHLHAGGLSDEFASELERRALLAPSFRRVFDGAFTNLHRRQTQLHHAAPEHFLPPRIVNWVILRDPTLHAFFQPFTGMCALLYASDLDDASTSVAHTELQMAVAERVVQTGRLSRAYLAAIPHLLAMSEEEVVDFRAGALRSTRPDADAVRALAELATELRSHVETEGIRAPGEPKEGYGRVKGTPLVVPKSFGAVLQTLAARIEEAPPRVLDAHSRHESTVEVGDHPRSRVLDFLRSERPEVLIADGTGQLLWRPGQDTAALERALPELGSAVADSLIADLATVGSVTDRFFDCVRGAREMPVPRETLEEAGGVYLHHDLGRIVYALEQPGIAPLSEAALPWSRRSLAARVMHEWGHVAVDAGVVGVPPSGLLALRAAEARVAAAFDQIVKELPSEYKTTANEELLEMREEGTRLVDLPYSRMEDYRANLLVKRLLPPEPMEAYVRTNVRSLMIEDVRPLRKLARYAYEAQYLWLAAIDDPWDYFMRSTYFSEEFVESGFVSLEAAKELFGALRALCECHVVDEARLDPRVDGAPEARS